MRLAIVTDIHGNRHALLAVLDDLQRQGVDDVVFGGDAALFGSRPRECWEHVLELGWHVVQGNTDRYIAKLEEKLSTLADPASIHAQFLRTNVDWASDRLGPSLIQAMGEMTSEIRFDSSAGTLLVVHGVPGDDEIGWARNDDEQEIAGKLGNPNAAVVVSGHTHTAAIRYVNNILAVNCGSVGRSHDGQPGLATYTVLEDTTGRWSANLRCVTYDEIAAHADLIDTGVPIPETFASTLLTGIEPR